MPAKQCTPIMQEKLEREQPVVLDGAGSNGSVKVEEDMAVSELSAASAALLPDKAQPANDTTSDVEHDSDDHIVTAPERIQAYAKLEFPFFNFYIQKLQVTIGRRPPPSRQPSELKQQQQSVNSIPDGSAGSAGQLVKQEINVDDLPRLDGAVTTGLKGEARTSYTKGSNPVNTSTDVSKQSSAASLDESAEALAKPNTASEENDATATSMKREETTTGPFSDVGGASASAALEHPTSPAGSKVDRQSTPEPAHRDAEQAMPTTVERYQGNKVHVDVDLGAIKAVSRDHARLFFDDKVDASKSNGWSIEVRGRNGLVLNGKWRAKGEIVRLANRSRIQIAERIFHFVLPNDVPYASAPESPSIDNDDDMYDYGYPPQPSVDYTATHAYPPTPERSPSPTAHGQLVYGSDSAELRSDDDKSRMSDDDDDSIQLETAANDTTQQLTRSRPVVGQTRRPMLVKLKHSSANKAKNDESATGKGRIGKKGVQKIKATGAASESGDAPLAPASASAKSQLSGPQSKATTEIRDSNRSLSKKEAAEAKKNERLRLKEEKAAQKEREKAEKEAEKERKKAERLAKEQEKGHKKQDAEQKRLQAEREKAEKEKLEKDAQKAEKERSERERADKEKQAQAQARAAAAKAAAVNLHTAQHNIPLQERQLTASVPVATVPTPPLKPQWTATNQFQGKSDKPPYTYAALIAQAIFDTPTKQATLQHIFAWLPERYPFFKEHVQALQAAVRRDLAVNRAFINIPLPTGVALWAIEPEQSRLFDGNTFLPPPIEQSAAPSNSPSAATPTSVAKLTHSPSLVPSPVKVSAVGDAAPTSALSATAPARQVPPTSQPKSTVPIVVSRPPSSYAKPAQPAVAGSSNDAAGMVDSDGYPPIAMHESKMYLSPTIFAALTPQQLANLQTLETKSALSILQAFVVNYFKQELKKRKKAEKAATVSRQPAQSVSASASPAPPGAPSSGQGLKRSAPDDSSHTVALKIQKVA